MELLIVFLLIAFGCYLVLYCLIVVPIKQRQLVRERDLRRRSAETQERLDSALQEHERQKSE
jgi:hypothetical protein